MKVFVYRNLHKKLWSVKALEGPNKGRVIGHTNTIYLLNPTFKVSEKGRSRVLKEKRKNVHAGVVGILADHPPSFKLAEEVTYNPYKGPSFTRVSAGTPVFAGDECFMKDGRVYLLT